MHLGGDEEARGGEPLAQGRAQGGARERLAENRFPGKNCRIRVSRTTAHKLLHLKEANNSKV